MKRKTTSPLTVIKTGFNTAISQPAILFPFITVAFIQILILEIIFFLPRFPLNTVFGDIIRNLFGEAYLHYPFNFLLINDWFQMAQIPIYVFINTFFIGVAVLVIQNINEDKPVQFKALLGQTLKKFFHLIFTGLISLGLLMLGTWVINKAILRAAEIRSTSGKFFILKRFILDGAPYSKFFLAILVTALLAYVIPIIMIEKKNFISAIIENFKIVFRSFFFTLTVVLLPGLLYIPILFFKSNGELMAKLMLPEIWVIISIVGIVTALFVDAIQYTSITIHYLSQKEDS